MNINRDQLKALTVQVAKEKFGFNIFERRPLMHAVEKRVKVLGHWEPKDDEDSRSRDPKSIGLATIDRVISDLKIDGGLLHLNHNQWRVPN